MLEHCDLAQRLVSAIRKSAGDHALPERRMNRDIAKGNFTQLKGKIKEQWGKLTDDEIDELEGKSEILAGKLQERYGLSKEDAEREAKEFRTQNDWN
jgi:uncharacterized protein YjbJ (UPF0337 family)